MSNLNKTIDMDGNFELFDNKLLKIRGTLSGIFSIDGVLLLSGFVTNYGLFPMPDAEAFVTESNVTIVTSFIGAKLTLTLEKDDSIFLEGGPLVFEFKAPVSYKIGGQITIDFDIKAKAELSFKLFSLPADIQVKIFGYVLNENHTFEFSFNTDQIFNEIDDLINDVEDKIIEKIEAKEILEEFINDQLCDLKESLESDLNKKLIEKNNKEEWLAEYHDICWMETESGEYIIKDNGCPISLSEIEVSINRIEDLGVEIENIKNKIDLISSLHFARNFIFFELIRNLNYNFSNKYL